MDNTINGRTPEEIKKGLECFDCDECSYSRKNNDGEARCKEVEIDALALINQLQEDKKQLERERDEARNDLDTINYANTELYSAYEAMKRERDAAVEAAKVKPFTWEEAIQDDCFLEIKDDEYIDAALNIFASSHDEFDEEDLISYLTNNTPEDEVLILYRGDYNRKWRCWPRRPTDEERAAAKWEVE